MHGYVCVCIEISYIYMVYVGFPGSSVIRNLPAMQKTQVQSLRQEDPLEGMATHSSVVLENPLDRGAWQAYSL